MHIRSVLLAAGVGALGLTAQAKADVMVNSTTVTSVCSDNWNGNQGSFQGPGTAIGTQASGEWAVGTFDGCYSAVEGIFQLPTLPAGQQVTSASLAIDTAWQSQVGGQGPQFSANLVGISNGTQSAPQLADYTAPGTVIQADWITPSVSNWAVINTAPSVGGTLAAYINGSGYQAGNYVILRLNVDPNQSNLLSNWEIYLFQQNPMTLDLTTTSVPEPGILSLAGLAGVMLLRRRS